MSIASVAAARAALADERFETARRLALACPPGEETALVLHDALVRLGDVSAAMNALTGAGQGFEAALRRLDDLHRASAYHGFFRDSPEAARGLSYEEFLAGRHAQRAALVSTLLTQIGNDVQAGRAREVLRRLVRDGERRAPCDAPALAELDRLWPEAPPARVPAAVPVQLCGRIRFPDGVVPSARVTLGVETRVMAIDPLAVDPHVISVDLPDNGAIHVLSAPLAADGSFAISGSVPPGTGFLALTLAEDQTPGVLTRFLARGLTIDGTPLAVLDLACVSWISAPAVIAPEPPPERIMHGDRTWHRQAVEVLNNPFWHDFPRQDLRLAWPAPPAGMEALVWCDGAPLPHQIDRGGQILVFAGAPMRSSRVLGWYYAEAISVPIGQASLLRVDADGCSAVLNTGRSAFRVPWGAAADGAAPVLAVIGPDRQWRGHGRWQLPAAATLQRSTTVIADGPLECVVEVAYRFITGERCSFLLTVHAGEEYLLISESGEALGGATFIFGLEDFRGGRGYLHWGAEGESPHWHDLIDVDRELARLQESVPWWIPPAGFAWAASFDGLERRDQIGLFTRRRGDWIDHAFAAIANGPPPGGHELDWPYPEMVGSTISMITVASTADGRLEMRFPRFAGERHWGLLASDVGRGDGPLKELQQVRHKTSFPRFDEVRRWHLDRPDEQLRPCLTVEREHLPELRRRIDAPGFAELWARLQHDSRYGDAEAMRFAVTGDPATGWRLARRLASLVPAQVRCLLLSRENGDVWSPVGGRVWAPQAQAYDAVVSSGAFTAAEEREVRAGILLAGHMFHSPDLMNWRYGGRNANFEADRVDVVGSVGLCFPGNSDAELMVAHVIERMWAALNAYCTPGSGKWYENPSCYYLHGMKCRMAIASHLAAHGRIDLAAVPRLADYMGWLLHMLTPRLPVSDAVMRDGCDHAAYAVLTKVRRIAPIGDHAHLGPWVPDMAAVMAKWLRAGTPALASALRWAWDEGGRDGGYFGSASQLLAQSEPEDLTSTVAQAPTLPSRRLEGFGAVFRGKVGNPDEFMLLAKLGPGGYRYHRSEGSFILIADGRPLVYDGGEAGEAWRHSSITYHEARLPPSAGRIECFASLPALDYAQGIHPVVLAPGDSIFLSDSCEHPLVEEAHRRARITRPAAARAWLWVKGAQDDYVVVWDRLDVPAEVVHRWNLQVMAGSEVGDLSDGLRFHGRFGTDLQVLMPGGGERPWTVEEVRMHEYHQPVACCVAQRHLEVTSRGSADWLAVLRPLAPGVAPLASAPLYAMGRCVGAHITSAGIDDRVVLGRTPCTVVDQTWHFSGSAGACLRRGGGLRLVLLGAGRISVGDAVLESDGPAAELDLYPERSVLHQDGPGLVLASVAGTPIAQGSP